jgi:hypothetical protein
MSKNADKRMKTLLCLVNHSKKLKQHRNNIVDEFSEFLSCSKIQPLRRRRLFKMLHALRGMETAVLEVCDYHGVKPTGKTPGLGTYLVALSHQQLLPASIQLGCRHYVVRLRNQLAHKAGVYPIDDNHLDLSVQRMEACLAFLLK